MSDHDQLPQSSGDFVLKFIWGTIVFALGFEGIAKLVEGELRTAGWCFGAAIVLSLALVHRQKIVDFTRSNMVPILITLGFVGALVLGVAVGGLLSRLGALAPTPLSAGRVTWNFDQPGDNFFLNMGRLGDQELRIVGFQAKGKNTSPDPITEFSGVMRSDLTNAQRPIYLFAQEPSSANRPPIGPLFMFPTLPEDTFGIPGLADFDISTHNSAFTNLGTDGDTVSDFLRNFGAFTIVLKYDGATIERHYTIEQIKAQVALFEKQTSPQTTSVPRVTRKPTAAPVPTLPFLLPPTPSPPDGQLTPKG